MKERKVTIIKVIGILMFIFACCMIKNVFADNIFNGKDLIFIFTFIGGLCLMFKKD